MAVKTLAARIIALEGIDQSGKQTQTRLLARRLGKLGYKVAIVSFPIYTSPAGRRIRAFLRGEKDYSPETLHMLYSLNRWENQELIRQIVTKEDFLIANRYTPSNLAYGVARHVNFSWLEGLDKGLPPPDLVIVLDASVPASFARKSKGRDVHERDRQFLVRVRRTYKLLAHRLGWKTVDAASPVRLVESDVWSIVRRRFRLPQGETSKRTMST